MSTVDTLITEVKLKGGFPDDNYFTDAEMLLLMNSALKTVITPLIMKMKEEYFTQQTTYSITAGGTYKIPPRCIGNKLRDVKLLVDDAYTDLNRLFEEDRQADESGYYISRNSITLSDDIETGTLAVTYFLSPSQLILEASAAQVLTIDSATQITVAALPSSILTTTPVDFVEANGPYDILALDQTIATISGTTLTFSSLPSGLAVGDYVTLSGQAPVAVIPEELHPLLVQATLVNCLSSKKDAGLKDAKDMMEEMKRDLLDMIDTRVESNDVSFRGQGLLSYIRRR